MTNDFEMMDLFLDISRAVPGHDTVFEIFKKSQRTDSDLAGPGRWRYRLGPASESTLPRQLVRRRTHHQHLPRCRQLCQRADRKVQLHNGTGIYFVVKTYRGSYFLKFFAFSFNVLFSALSVFVVTTWALERCVTKYFGLLVVIQPSESVRKLWVQLRQQLTIRIHTCPRLFRHLRLRQRYPPAYASVSFSASCRSAKHGNAVMDES